MGDAVAPIGTGVDVGSGIVADMPAFGNVTTQSGGVAGSLAGTITSAGVMTLTSGGHLSHWPICVRNQRELA